MENRGGLRTLGRSKKLLRDSGSQGMQSITVSAVDGPGSERPLRLRISFAVWLLREARGMTQDQLAARMKTTRQQISDLEIFQSPTVATLFRIARALQVTPRSLLLIAEARRRREWTPPLKRRGMSGRES
jgi:DNA-binding XRE family transcriptional regulator